MSKFGILTGGGDAPGLNAAIRAAVYKSEREGHQVVGIQDGWKGLIEEGKVQPLDRRNTAEILPLGGTIIGTSRTNPYKKPGDVDKVIANFSKLGLECLIAVGGEDTLGVAAKLHKEKGLPVVGVPKTIDNDLSCTDFTFGYDTAINIATSAIDRLHTTARSHHRVLIVEAMGRHAGWIAWGAGLAGSADFVLVPEKPIDVERLCEAVKKRYLSGRKYAIIVVSEGAVLSEEYVTKVKELDEFGHVRLGGIGEQLAKIVQEKTGFETRSVVLGHLQRGGNPTAFDRILGTRLGLKGAELAINKEYGMMAALRGTGIVAVKLEEAVGQLKTLPDDYYAVAELFF